MSKRKVSIVFEESEEFGGRGFNVYLDGVVPEAHNMTDGERVNKLSPIDFWAFECFRICMALMKKTGAFHSARPKGE